MAAGVTIQAGRRSPRCEWSFRNRATSSSSGVRCAALLRAEVGDTAYSTWLKPLDLAHVDGDRVVIAVPTQFMRDWVVAHYADRIRGLWTSINPSVRTIALERAATPPPARPAWPIGCRPPRPCCGRAGGRRRSPANETAALEELGARLDPRFTFETFVVGKPNEFAVAAAERVATSPKPPFNPLFLYGGVGLGKTHLMHAIAHRVKQLDPNRRVVYLSAEKFMYQFVRALRSKDTMTFKELFRSVDLLMVDDVQFISGKDSTQEEFFHTFNTLVDRGRQIVISADRSPSDLSGLEERIRSRLGWGLVADIHPTTYELRLGILQAKAEQLRRGDPAAGDRVPGQPHHQQRARAGGCDEPDRPPGEPGAEADLDRHGAGGAEGPAARQRPAGDHRGDPEGGGRALQHPDGRHDLGPPLAGHGPAAPDGDVPGQAADPALAAGDRQEVRRPRPHHGDARGPADREARRPRTAPWPTISRRCKRKLQG